MAGIFTSIKRVLSGEVLRRIDTDIAGCTLSLRLKRDRGSGEEYVVLATVSSGSYNYFPLEMDEFDRLLAAAKDIRAAARSRARTSASEQIT